MRRLFLLVALLTILIQGILEAFLSRPELARIRPRIEQHFKEDDNVIGQDIKDFNAVAAQFYSNALDTKTTGLDVAATYKTEIKDGKLSLTLGGNFNSMALVRSLLSHPSAAAKRGAE